jgi:sec-independent protein translocase protein TatC
VNESHATFFEHFGELRKRLIRCLLALGLGVLIALPFQELWFQILKYPSRNYLKTLKYLALPDAFVIRLNLALIVGLLIALPIVVWQLWKFVVPALYEKERQWVVRLSGISVLLFWSGVMFAYWVIIPIAIRFFVGFESPELSADITLKNYMHFAAFMLLMAGIAFQVPIVMVFLMGVGIVPREVFTRNRRVVVIVILVLSALFTPPDPMTMLLLAGPFYLLFEISLWVILLFGKKKE